MIFLALALGTKAAKGTLRATKSGRHGRCMHSLRFYICQGGKTPGRLVLKCSKCFNGGSAEEPRCWLDKLFSAKAVR